MDSPRRMGAKDSLTRTKLLDAAERLMLEEGYAAVTSRRVGREAGISSQLVHYYFRTMDDLFLEVFRRRAEEGFGRFARAIEAQPSLRTIWSSMTDGRGSVFNLEFAALANHRKAIRAEMASYAERFRTMQLDSDLVGPRGHAEHCRPGSRRRWCSSPWPACRSSSRWSAALGVSGGHERDACLHRAVPRGRFSVEVVGNR